MKLELTEKENAYLHNMVRSSAAFYEPYVRIYGILQHLTTKLEPPRSYVQLKADEQANLKGLIQQALEVATKKKNETSESEATDHLTEVLTILNSVNEKLSRGVIL